MNFDNTNILNNLVQELYGVQKEISDTFQDSNISQSNPLFEKRTRIEKNISKFLRSGDGAVIEKNPFLDYCIYHSSVGKNGGAFSFMPKVCKFANYVKNNKGKMILELIDEIPYKFGIISDEIKFEIEDKGLRHIHVPVEQLFRYDNENNRWINGERVRSELYISQSIFARPEPSFISGYWHTNSFEEHHIQGRKPRKEIEIYIGEPLAESVLKKQDSIPAVENKKGFFVSKLAIIKKIL